MRSRTQSLVQLLVFAALASTASVALADKTPPAADAKPSAPAEAAAPAKTSEDKDKPDVDKDGVRFRGGISAGGVGLFVSGLSAGLGGADGRLGVQIMDLIGVYEAF